MHLLPAASALILTTCALLVPISAAAHPEPANEPLSAHSSSAASSAVLMAWGGEEARGTAHPDQAYIVEVIDRQRLGRGGWICSTSGSGQLSACFER